MTRLQFTCTRSSRTLTVLVMPILALAFVGVIGAAVSTLPAAAFEPARVSFGTVSSIGTELFGRFFYPFEVISLLLVAAMVGAVLLAKRRL